MHKELSLHVATGIGERVMFLRVSASEHSTLASFFYIGLILQVHMAQTIHNAKVGRPTYITCRFRKHGLVSL